MATSYETHTQGAGAQTQSPDGPSFSGGSQVYSDPRTHRRVGDNGIGQVVQISSVAGQGTAIRSRMLKRPNQKTPWDLSPPLNVSHTACESNARTPMIKMLPRPVGHKRMIARRERRTFGLASSTYSGSFVART